MNDFIHEWAPHTEQAIYGLTLASALLFAALGTIIALARGKGFHLINTFTQAGSGATFPTFVILPFVPFDQEHLLQMMEQSWVMVGIAGALGAGVTISGLWMLPMGRERHQRPYG